MGGFVAFHAFGRGNAENGEAVAQHLAGGAEQGEAGVAHGLVVDEHAFGIVEGMDGGGEILEVVADHVGSFVAGGNAELIREERMREVEGLLAQAVDRGRACGLTDAELQEMLALVLE